MNAYVILGSGILVAPFVALFVMSGLTLGWRDTLMGAAALTALLLFVTAGVVLLNLGGVQ